VRAVARNIHRSSILTADLQAESKNARLYAAALTRDLRNAAEATDDASRQRKLSKAYISLSTVTNLTGELRIKFADALWRVRGAQLSTDWIASGLAAAGPDPASLDLPELALISEDVGAAHDLMVGAHAKLSAALPELQAANLELKALITGASATAQVAATKSIGRVVRDLDAGIIEARARRVALDNQLVALGDQAAFLQSLPGDHDASPLASQVATARSLSSQLHLKLADLQVQLEEVTASTTAIATGTRAAEERLAIRGLEIGSLPAVAGAVDDLLLAADDLELVLHRALGSVVGLAADTSGLAVGQVVVSATEAIQGAFDQLNSIYALDIAGELILAFEDQLVVNLDSAMPDPPFSLDLPEADVSLVPPYPEVPEAGGAITFAAPSETWLTNHCKAPRSTANGTPNVIRAIVPYSGFKSGVQVSNYQAPVRDIIRAMDNALDESSSTFSQHYRLVCSRNADGSWHDIAVTSVRVPQAADSNDNNMIGCGEADKYLAAHERWGDADMRHIRFFDTSIDTGGPNNGWCFYGGSNALGVATAGLSNPNNYVYGFANIDAGQWPGGANNFVTAGAMQEFGHAIGLVSPNMPGGVSDEDAKYHTKDYPDYMNSGYFVPPDVRINCSPVPTTFRDTYVDCGRDTYWDPTPEDDEKLCHRYNVATDSLYFRPRAPRPNACPPA
jgi:hypothetical protein